MDAGTVTINITAEDNASGKIRSIASNLSTIESNTTSLNNALRRYNTSMSNVNRLMIRSLKMMGGAIIDFTKDSINNYKEFSEQHAKTLGAMASDYDKTTESQKKFLENSEKLKRQALQLGTYGVNGNGSLTSVTGVSELQTELVKAGISSKDIADTDITKQLLQFSQANDIKTSDAVQFAVSLGSQFNIGIDKWGEMLDKVSHTADLSIIDVKDIVESMKYAGGISSGLNRPLEEVLGIISTLGNFGLRGSQAGNGIQAFYTRLLTQDSTVINDAARELAPKDALKAFYSFSRYAKSDGTGLTYDQIKNSNSYESMSKLGGNLKPMSEILTQLDETMSGLDDAEQAWFAKKLFGLYQMKSAYALINGDNNDLNAVEEEIKNNSIGTNAIKLQQLISSQYGATEALTNLWEGLKTGVGQDLSNTITAIMQEAYKYLSNPDEYKIDYTKIRKELKLSSKAIEKNWGKSAANAVNSIGNTLLDWTEIAQTVAPEFLNGLGDVVSNLADFDIFGTIRDWGHMIDTMRDSTSDLPDNLKGMAEAAISVIDAFGKLAVFNFGAKILQAITSAMQLAYTIKNMIVKAGVVNVQGGTGIGTGGTSGTGGTNSSGGTTAPIFFDKSGGFWKNSSKLGKALGIISSGFELWDSGSQALYARDAFKAGDMDQFTTNALGSLGTAVGAFAGSFFGPIGTVLGGETAKYISRWYANYINEQDKNNYVTVDGKKRLIIGSRRNEHGYGYSTKDINEHKNSRDIGSIDKKTISNLNKNASNIDAQASRIALSLKKVPDLGNTNLFSMFKQKSNLSLNNLTLSPQSVKLASKIDANDLLANKIKVDNALQMTPKFNISAPKVNVNVKVDKDGNVTKEIGIIKSDVTEMQNEWFKRVIRQNG